MDRGASGIQAVLKAEYGMRLFLSVYALKVHSGTGTNASDAEEDKSTKAQAVSALKVSSGTARNALLLALDHAKEWTTADGLITSATASLVSTKKGVHAFVPDCLTMVTAIDAIPSLTLNGGLVFASVCVGFMSLKVSAEDTEDLCHQEDPEDQAGLDSQILQMDVVLPATMMIKNNAASPVRTVVFLVFPATSALSADLATPTTNSLKDVLRTVEMV